MLVSFSFFRRNKKIDKDHLIIQLTPCRICIMYQRAHEEKEEENIKAIKE